jgi:signal transduction histidine kinase
MEKFIVALINLIAISLGGWVYFSNRKEKINQWFGVMSIFTILWVDFVYLAKLSTGVSEATLWYRLNFGTVWLFILSAYYFYVLYFLKRKGKNLLMERLVTGICILFFSLSVFTNLVIKTSEIREWGPDWIYGSLGNIYNIFALLIPLIIVFYLLRNYFSLSEAEKLRVWYFLLGTFIAIFLNIIFNIVFPTFLKIVKYQHFGDYSLIFILSFTAYTIIVKQLFGIRILLTQALVGVIAILLLAQAMTAIPNWFEFSWKFGLFLIFLYFGYLLIRSVLQEIKRRAELQRLYEEVDKLSRAKSEFLSIASHQLKTPLTAIKGYISMILEGSYGKFEEKGRPPLEKVYQSNERLIRLVNDLLNVSRIESGTLMTDFQKTSVEKMITSVIDELKIKADERKLYLNWQTPSASSGHILPEIMADTDKLRQVIMNIIDNAIKYTEKGGITIKAELKDPSAKWPQGKILIEIKDTGEGMEKEEMDNMFGSFTRGRAGAKHWVSGLGLGLYIAKKFTELHGGKIWVESEGEGKGSTFYIELPVK